MDATQNLYYTNYIKQQHTEEPKQASSKNSNKTMLGPQVSIGICEDSLGVAL